MSRKMMRSLLIVALVVVGCEIEPEGPVGPLPTRDLAFGWGRQDVSRRIAIDPGTPWRPWKHIVIHHSATPRGSAATFDKMHRDGNGWAYGLGYHFVICNGDGGADGLVEQGPRWKAQRWGAHTGGTPRNEYNNYGIGICVVGDFSDRLPTRAQLASLRQLVRELSERFDIPSDRVIGHRDAPGTNTECPGDALHAWIHRTLRREL